MPAEEVKVSPLKHIYCLFSIFSGPEEEVAHGALAS